MRIFILLLLMCLSTLKIQSQETSFKLKGTIKDSIDNVIDAHVINLRSKDGAFSNDVGRFSINVKIGDSLLISSVQHKPHKFFIKKEHQFEKNISIYLRLNRYELDEIVLKKTKLKGSLLSDIKQKLPAPPIINAVTLGLPNAGRKKLSYIDRRIQTASTSSGGIPLDLIINLISGRLKKLKKEKKLYEENIDVDKIYGKMKHFLTSNFKIKEEDHYRFLYYCRTDRRFQRNILNNEFSLIDYLHTKAKEFYTQK